ncbi:hypothetical protein UA45_19220 [Morganella morganii]|uniref:Uncharacterized protein n=1 Tax=Morganella morganii TaxID=582 RepID=A0A0D8L324_MORMO|nr:hypothetical protein UA45_19220 [Morganella morganii]
MLSRVIEEIFPFVYFYYLLRKKKGNIYNITFSELDFYSKLSDEKITKRLEDEHCRAKEIDDKTFKFTLALSISLSIISAGASGVVKFLPESYLSPYISFIFFLSSFYMLWGGLISLGSLKTLPKFGYGTYFEINKDRDFLIKAISGQEKINIIRYMRNELSYMSLRNGFLLILIAIILCLIILAQVYLRVTYDTNL